MRIIDKMHDYYDYLQDSTDNLVFDRRGSYLLTKDSLCRSFNIWNYRSNNSFLLVQSGATYWLILVTITGYDKNYINDYINDYKLTLLTTWKNYDKAIKLFSIDTIDFTYIYTRRFKENNNYNYDKIIDNLDNLVRAVNNNEYRIDYNICDYNKHNTMPLLKACGIGNIINPSNLFYAIEEYFSMEKSKAETTEAKGTTNDDKIIMHGFDTKTSFRGKK